MKIICIIFFLSLSAFANITVSEEIYNTKASDFIPHKGDGQFSNYLAMNIPFRPVKKIYDFLISEKNKNIKSRGEAHITVVTPLEFWNNLLPSGITIEEINTLAQESLIQSSAFRVLCLGRGVLQEQNQKLETYYLVVESLDLIRIREKIQKLAYSKKKKEFGFDANKFYPHITVGFSKRDLHEADGIIKNQASCVGALD